MTQQILNDPDIDALLQKMRGETMPQGVHGDGRVKACGADRLAASALHRAGGDWAFRIGAREQHVPRARAFPVGAQDRKPLLREHDVTILAAFALAQHG